MKQNIDYKTLKEPNQAIFDLLRKTIYGTKGVKIKHCDTDKKLKELHQPDFHTLWNNNHLIAVAVYCKREINSKTKPLSAYYIRYFSVDPAHQGNGFGKLLTQNIEQHYKSTIQEKTIFYAYIEEKNIQSSGVSRHFQMKAIGKFTTVFFSRFFPKTNTHCSSATEKDLTQVKKLLSKQYSNHSTTFFNRIGYENNYHTYKENETITAGIQVIKTHWKMEKIPGIIGWLTINIFPYIPIFKRIANGKKFIYLGLEGIYYQPENIQHLITLIEHALAKNKTYKAFLYFDSKENIIDQLKQSGKLGLLNSIQKSPMVSISNQSILFSEEEQKELTSNNKYISAYDIT